MCVQKNLYLPESVAGAVHKLQQTCVHKHGIGSTVFNEEFSGA